MRIFLSYAHEQRPLAERIFGLLEAEGHTVFFDRESLVGGDSYSERIRAAITRSHVFIFLISEAALAEHCYALAEVDIVERLPPRRRPIVIPVQTGAIPIERLPPLLRSFTILEPKGDIAADVVTVTSAQQPRILQRRLVRVAPLVLVASVVVGVFMYSQHLRSRRAAPNAADQLLSDIRNKTPPAEQVKLIGMASNDGWMVSFDLADIGAREIFYRVDNDPEFKSTGSSSNVNHLTGAPQPNRNIRLEGTLGQPHEIVVKYVDNQGHEHGPFQFAFDPRAEYVRETKQILDLQGFVSFREYPAGHLTAEFANLVSYKNAFREIRYSVESDALDKTLKFRSDWSGTGPPDNRDDEDMVDIPISTTFICVKLLYIDGTDSDVKRIAVRTK